MVFLVVSAIRERGRSYKDRNGHPMSRIDATLSALKAQGRKALIPYVTAGFPQAESTTVPS
jgi:hypothetical protein